MLGASLPERDIKYRFNPKEEVSRIIVKLICKLPRAKCIEFCKKAIDEATPFTYVLAMHEIFTYKSPRDTENSFLNEEDIELISKFVIEKFDSELKRRNVLTDYTDEDLKQTFNIYRSVGKEGDVRKFLEMELKNNPRFPLKLVKIFTPLIYSSKKTAPYKSGFNIQYYNEMATFINPTLVYDILTKAWGQLNPETEVNLGTMDYLSDEQLIELFQKVHITVLANSQQ